MCFTNQVTNLLAEGDKMSRQVGEKDSVIRKMKMQARQSKQKTLLRYPTLPSFWLLARECLRSAEY